MTRIPTRAPWLVVLTLLLAACQGGAKPIARYAPSLARVAEIKQQTGLSGFGAAFLAMTALELVSSERNEYRFRATFPTKSTADLTVRVTPGQTYTPTAEELAGGPRAWDVHITHEKMGDADNLRLEYFLPDGARPAIIGAALDARPHGRMLGAARARLASYRALRPRDAFWTTPQDATDVTSQAGSKVVLQAVVAEATKGGLEAFEGMVEEGVLGEEAQGSLAKGASAVMDVIEAAETAAEHDAMVEELNQLEEEVRNPENDLTAKAYEEDPGLQQRLLDDIELARAELAAATALEFANEAIGVAAGLAELPVVGSLILAPVKNWNDQALKQATKERIDNLKKQISTGRLTRTPRQITPQPVDLPLPDTPEPRRKLKPGEWEASYEAVITSEAGGTTTTIKDRGTFTFTVNADGSLEGEGSGYYSQTQVSADSRGVGGTNYRFAVGGASAPELSFWLTPEGASPGSFKVIITTTAGQVLTVPGVVNNGPMLFSQEDVRLKEGTVHYNVRSPVMRDTRSLTLKK